MLVPNSGEFLHIFALFALLRSNFAEFLQFAAAGSFARNALVIVLGLTAPLSMPASANFFYFCSFLFDEQIYFPRRATCDDRTAAHLFSRLWGNNE